MCCGFAVRGRANECLKLGKNRIKGLLNGGKSVTMYVFIIVLTLGLNFKTWKYSLAILFPCEFSASRPNHGIPEIKYMRSAVFFLFCMLWLAICSLWVISSVIGNPLTAATFGEQRPTFFWGSNTDFHFFSLSLNSQLIQRLKVQTKLERREQLFQGCWWNFFNFFTFNIG